ncbi:hypothetical protein FSARC_4142 [Fusarium sarcochroum]|uniref:Peptidase S8/S53 domain-containing protein n=1 Tax=Fusarium sarcochroum TaxID=1208366 RepID=A0A8H4XAX9_9HYPO|nr:hypothetical protein FSARC_4142 [Fusarium sarcochroum]
MPVRKAASECALLLAQAQSNRSLSPDTRLGLEDITFMFKVWAGNIGVFAPGNASIEYRLREDKDVMEALLSMLVSLRGHIEQIINPPLREEDEDEDEDENNEEKESTGGKEEGDLLEPAMSMSTSASSSSSLTLDSDGTEEEHSSMSRHAPSTMNSLQKANGVINHLYRLTSVIRKPVSSTENMRVRDFIAKQISNGETEELYDVEDHARCHMQARFPKAPNVLVERLTAAVVFRRMKLRYRQRHEFKLQQGVESSFHVAPTINEISDDLPPTSALLRAQRRGDNVQSMTKSVKGLKRDSHSITWSATNASSIHKSRFANYAQSTALSGITHGAMARLQKLDVPLPPGNSEEGIGKTKCTYCMRFITKEEMEEPRWTRHVLKDIDPYVCLFEECKQGDALFHSVEEWLGHMQWQHTVLWTCQAPEHEKYIYDSETGLEEHIRHMHPGSFTEGQLPKLVDQGALPAPDTFAMLCLSFQATETAETVGEFRVLCPICRDFPQPSALKEKEGEASHDLQSHIAGHLESIALLSLPDNDLPGGEESNVKQSDENSIALVRDIADHSPTMSSHEPSEPFQIYDSDHDPTIDIPVPDLEDEEASWDKILAQLQLPFQGEDPLLLRWRERMESSDKMIEKEMAELHEENSPSISANVDLGKGDDEQNMRCDPTTSKAQTNESKDQPLPSPSLVRTLDSPLEHPEQSVDRYRWMDCMTDFAAQFKKIESSTDNITGPTLSPVEIALIDDGFDITHPDFEDAAGSKFRGKSFHHYQDGSIWRVSPYYDSTSGHGTLMARLIHKICPSAIIHIIKLQTLRVENQPNHYVEIEPDGVVNAINYARRRGAQIICMSWTMKPPTRESMMEIDDAIHQAINASGILFFCAVDELGTPEGFQYPYKSNPAIFKIGGVNLATIYDAHRTDFLFPGHSAVRECSDDRSRADMNDFGADSDNSIANALAVGLAALMIECVRLSNVYASDTKQSDPSLPREVFDLNRIRNHNQIHYALSRITKNQNYQNNYVEVWDTFSAATEELKQSEGSRTDQLRTIARLARHFLDIE